MTQGTSQLGNQSTVQDNTDQTAGLRHDPNDPSASGMPSPNWRELVHRLGPSLRRGGRLVALGIVFALLSAVLAQIAPLVMRYLVNESSRLLETGAPLSKGYSVLAWSAGLFLAVALARSAVDFGLRQVGERLKVRIERELSSQAAEHLLTLDATYFERPTNDPGKLAQRVERGAEGLAKIVKTASIDLVPMCASAVGAVVVMLAVNLWVGIVALCTLPFYVLLARLQATRQAGVRMAIKDLREDRSSELLNVVGSIAVVQSYTREDWEAARHADRCAALAARENRHHLVNHACDALKTWLDNLGALIIVVATAYFVLRDGLPIGVIPLHYMLYGNVTAPIRELHRVYTEYQEALAFSSGLFEIFDARPEISSTSDAVRPATRRAGRGHVRLEGVVFGYSGGPPVLHGLDLNLVPGQTTALVGLSGAGKTTTAKLLPRFYDPDFGRVLLDGTDLRDLDVRWLRERIGMVLQRDHVVAGSIADNIRYGRLDASPAEIAAAASRAGLDDVLARAQDGLDTPARRLSGGELQRVALARAFLKDPPVLVLDEPTASLDALNTERIKAAIDDLRRGRTVLVISHNPALFVEAAQIYVLKDGRLVEQGSHASLYVHGGHYAEIIDANVESLNVRKLLISSGSDAGPVPLMESRRGADSAPLITLRPQPKAAGAPRSDAVRSVRAGALSKSD